MPERAGRGRARGAEAPAAAPADPQADPVSAVRKLPRGRVPTIGMRELVGALQRRRERRRAAALELQGALAQLTAGVERHLERVARLRSAVEAQGGDLRALRHCDSTMARMHAELRAAELSLAAACSRRAGTSGTQGC